MKSISKKTFIFLLLAIVSTALFAQKTATYSVKANSFKKVELNFSAPSVRAETVFENSENYTQLFADDYFQNTRVGAPALPIFVKLVEIPLCDSVLVSYTINKRNTLSANELGVQHPILPAQKKYPKSYDGDRPFNKDAAIYSQNAFWGEEVVRIEQTGTARNINLATIFVSPIQYNPVTGEFLIFDDIDVEITFKNARETETYEMKKLHASRAFATANSLVINPIGSQTKENLSAPIRYLIVSHSMFRGEFDDFIAWKKRKGFLVDIVYTDDPAVGTTFSSIQSFLKSQYTNATPQNPAPTYVLLVGDVAQIPAKTIGSDTWWSSAHPTDLYYFTWTTGDNIPDCYYGRFSAETVSELRPQIEKTLMYEQYTMPDPAYLDRAVLIAGADEGRTGDRGFTHANPAIHYLENNYVNSNYGYTTVNSFYNPHSSSASTSIRNALSAGAGFANYSAHCDVTEWSDPRFRYNDVYNLQNEGKYGLMIGNCCQSDKFDETSLGEVLLRTAKKGAVGYIGGSNYTYWDEDVYWAVGNRTSITSSFSYDSTRMGVYDRLFHTHGERYSDWYTTFGSFNMCGNLSVQSSSTDADMKLYYWEIYHLKGDPSVMAWLTQAKTMAVTTSPASQGITSIEVHAVPHAYVALTVNLNLIAAAFADENGNATLTFPPLTNISNAELAISAQNYKTFFMNLKSATGIATNDLAANIYPNPASDVIVVKANQNLKEVQLFDLTGKLLLQETVLGSDHIILNISTLSNGIYFVKVVDENQQVSTQKIIKNN